MEAEGYLDPGIGVLRRQIDSAIRRKTVAQLLESARTRMEEDEYPLALQKVREALDLDPQSAEALALKERIEHSRGQRQVDEWYRLARQHVDACGFDHARQALQNVLELRPADTRALELLSAVERREQEYVKLHAEKEQLYQAALDAYERAELSTALSKIERVLELDRKAPDTGTSKRGTAYQSLYNQVRSERDAMMNSYAEARRELDEGNFPRALALCEEYLKRYPGQALFQALKFDVEEQRRQKLSGFVAEVDRRADAEPDLDKRVEILRDAAERFPEEEHFQRALRLARDKRDLVNSIVVKARRLEEQHQFGDALAQWEILRTIYAQYPGLEFEVERLRKRREQQAREDAKARWVERIDGHLEAGEYTRANGPFARCHGRASRRPRVGRTGQARRAGPGTQRRIAPAHGGRPAAVRRRPVGRGTGGARQGLRPGAAQPGDPRRARGHAPQAGAGADGDGLETRGPVSASGVAPGPRQPHRAQPAHADRGPRPR